MKNKNEVAVKSDKITVDKVVLSVGGKELSLTLDQARGLKDALEQLLGTTPSPLFYIPICPQPAMPQPWQQFPITCYSGNGAVVGGAQFVTGLTAT